MKLALAFVLASTVTFACGKKPAPQQPAPAAAPAADSAKTDPDSAHGIDADAAKGQAKWEEEHQGSGSAAK